MWNYVNVSRFALTVTVKCVNSVFQPSRHLLVQSQQWKHQDSVEFVQSLHLRQQNVINNVVIIRAFTALLLCLHCWLHTSKCPMRCPFLLKWKTNFRKFFEVFEKHFLPGLHLQGLVACSSRKAALDLVRKMNLKD